MIFYKISINFDFLTKNDEKTTKNDEKTRFYRKKKRDFWTEKLTPEFAWKKKSEKKGKKRPFFVFLKNAKKLDPESYCTTVF